MNEDSNLRFTDSSPTLAGPEPSHLVFSAPGARHVLTIYPDGRTVKGDGLSDEEMFAAVFSILAGKPPRSGGLRFDTPFTGVTG